MASPQGRSTEIQGPRESGAPGSARQPELSLAGVSKKYGSTWVVRHVDLTLTAGQIHGLCGENGAGKSTLVRILGGVIRPDEGAVRLAGEEVRFANAAEARSRGVGVIHQHPMLFPDLSVAENIALAEPGLPALKLVNPRQATARAKELLASLGVQIDPSLTAGTLTIASKQLVEIAKSLQSRPRVLILDEPTASLSPHEVRELFTIIQQLSRDGTAVLMVNHRLSELMELCDWITVLRNGATVHSAAKTATTGGELIRHMVGHEVERAARSSSAQVTAAPSFETHGLTRTGVFGDVDLCLRPGQIVGMAGLVGAGRTEIARVLFGLDDADEGSVLIGGARHPRSGPKEIIASGVVLVPEDRHRDGLALNASIAENVAITHLATVSGRLGLVSRAKEEALAKRAIREFRIRCTGPRQLVQDLSGGNQQKVVLAKWLLGKPRVLLLDEPTAGVDVGSQQEIHEMIRKLAASGAAVLLISSDITELLELANRILVVNEGRLVAEFDAGSVSETEILAAALGEAGT